VRTVAARVLLGAAIASAFVAALAAVQWWEYSRLPFNSEGRFFDAAESVVYTVDGQAGWAMIAVASFALAVGALTISKKLGRPRAIF
jgi:hypothetical protein